MLQHLPDVKREWCGDIVAEGGKRCGVEDLEFEILLLVVAVVVVFEAGELGIVLLELELWSRSPVGPDLVRSSMLEQLHHSRGRYGQ